VKKLSSLFLVFLVTMPALYAQLLKPELGANYPAFVWGTSLLLATVTLFLGLRLVGLARKADALQELVGQSEEQASKLKGQISERSDALATLKRELARLEELDRSQRQRLEASKKELAGRLALSQKLVGASDAAALALTQATQEHGGGSSLLERQAVQVGESLMTELDDLLADSDQSTAGLDTFVSHLNQSFDGIKLQTEELGELCRRIEELRLNQADTGYVKTLEVMAANMGLVQEIASGEESYSHRLQVLGLNLKNRDASQRLLVSSLERQGTEIALRTEAALRTLRSRLDEIAAIQTSHSTVISRIHQLRVALGQQNGQLVKSCKEMARSVSRSLTQIQEPLQELTTQVAELSTGSKGA
jgi:hypothetical protein